MATYAIGDVQGCFATLQTLLKEIHFNAKKDMLWFTGDLVNRGSQSLETLRFIKSLGTQQKVVLGNHDLHLLAVAHNTREPSLGDTLDAILTASDRNELIHWLLQQPLLHHDPQLNYTLIHAGLEKTWDLAQAKSLSQEVAKVLQSEQRWDFFRNMYGNEPARWDNQLGGWDRLRCITNYFTRARFCYPDGSLELKTKENIRPEQTELIPWFRLPGRRTAETDILFGHWAALGGVTNTPHVFALDTGCVWGFKLTAMRLEDGTRFSVPL